MSITKYSLLVDLFSFWRGGVSDSLVVRERDKDNEMFGFDRKLRFPFFFIETLPITGQTLKMAVTVYQREVLRRSHRRKAEMHFQNNYRKWFSLNKHFPCVRNW